MPRIQTALYLSGEDVDLEALTSALALSPTGIRKKESWPRPSIEAGIAKDAWEYRLDKEECNAVSSQVDKLQSVFSDKVRTLIDLEKSFSVKANVVVIIEMDAGDAPELVLSTDNIGFLHRINAEIGFDLYID